MSEFSITSSNFDDGEEIPKKFGYKLVPKPHSTPGVEVKYLWGKK